MRFILKHRQYSKIILANLISRFGDNIDMIAFSWLIYQVTGSASWSATIIGFNLGVSIIFQPFIGGFVENKNKKKIMIIADLLRFLLILILCALAYYHLVNEWILVAFTICISFVETFRIPAGFSIIPMILLEEDFDEGISLNNAFSTISSLIGISVSGILIASIGTIGAIFIDGITFLISAVLIALIKYEDTSKQNITSSNLIIAAKDGLSFLLKHRQLLLICIICSWLNACIIPFESLKAVYVNLYFNADVNLLSIMGGSSSIGMIIGSFTYKYIAKVNFFQHKERMLSLGGVAIGIYYLLMFWVTIFETAYNLKIVYVLLFTSVYGLFLAYLNSYVQIFFVKNVNKEYMSRISAIAATVTNIGSPISAFLIAFIASVLTCNYILLLVGGITIVSFLILSNMLANSEDEKE